MKLDHLTLKQLQTWARQLARKYAQKPVIIGLIGPLGVGKTTFTQAFAKGLNVKAVSSPTFVIMHEHDLAARTFYHLDFYRLTKGSQLADLGLAEILAGPNIVIIEWADRFPVVLQQCDLVIKIKINPDQTRHVLVQPRQT